MTDSTGSLSPRAVPGRLPAKHRRPHQKSKSGCLDCRRRRVKCDEQKPRCRACVRRDVPCDYTGTPGGPFPDQPHTSHIPNETRPAQSPQGSESLVSQAVSSSPRVLVSAQTPETSISAATPAALVLPPTPRSLIDSPETFQLEDLALHHHWTLFTSLTISGESHFAGIWQNIIPEIGFQFPFVTHSIMSLAALHMAQTRGSQEKHLVAHAAEHYNVALRGFRKEVINITESNSEALFCFCLINVLYVFAMSTLYGSGTSEKPTGRKDRILGVELIPMIRGIEAVLLPTHNHLRFGRLKIIMSVGNWDELDPGSLESQGVDAYLCQTRQTWANSGDADTYDEALRILRKCRLFVQQFATMDSATLSEWGYNRAWSGPMLFIHFGPAAYFTLLQQRQPQALILFAHFGVLMHDLRQFWFIGAWGKEIVEVVGDLLGSYWAPWVSWPMEAVGLGSVE
ncbi:hypothetical protein F5X68DRAFT_267653 [Plectosphaerella plurivora]|uniref:Zn(2)-C6 fungal-type domain-containing protein n=1 Tax=Plectosphaerella plurivora TaxID=936078 RepID=A0A9P9ACV3_9PEZI|nr:hypothetical protein F5X68DRAFT_267653 [Plectosphaerella plurivora]